MHNQSSSYTSDRTRLRFFVAHLKQEHKIGWYPKHVFTIYDRGCNDISPFLKFLTNCNILSANSVLTHPKSLASVFPIDGFIVVTDGSNKMMEASARVSSSSSSSATQTPANTNQTTVFKIKPPNHLTIDVKYQFQRFYSREGVMVQNISDKSGLLYAGGIYRCYWKDGEWVATDLRTDKSLANPISIINQVTELHTNPITVELLRKLEMECPYYMPKKMNISEDTMNFLQQQTTNQMTFLQSFIDYFGASVPIIIYICSY